MSDLWYTPKELIDCITKYTGRIGLDPASSPAGNKNIDAQLYLTEKQNGLTQNWIDWVLQAENQLIWVNPPYSKQAGGMDFWAQKIMEVEAEGIKTLALVNARTDTSWFHRMMKPKNMFASVMFFEGRIKFELEGTKEKTSPRHNNALFLYNFKQEDCRKIEDEIKSVKPAGIRSVKSFYI